MIHFTNHIQCNKGDQLEFIVISMIGIIVSTIQEKMKEKENAKNANISNSIHSSYNLVNNIKNKCFSCEIPDLNAKSALHAMDAYSIEGKKLSIDRLNFISKNVKKKRTKLCNGTSRAYIICSSNHVHCYKLV